MTAILEDADDEGCCSDDAMEVESEQNGSRLDLRGCENPFPSLFSVRAEHQAVCTDSCASAGVCDPAWARSPTPAQPSQRMSRGLPYPEPTESCCVMFVGEPLQQEGHAPALSLPCLLEALQVPSLADRPSFGPADACEHRPQKS